ncbi:MAG: serine hydrolase [Cyclobacteriaceae bacterium]|nr:serine hydrolase [Cyclobacteriaceae bacterium]
MEKTNTSLRKTFKGLLGTLLILVLSIPILAQPDTKAFEKYIEQARIDWDVPGMAVAIVKDGKIVFEEGFGMLEAGKKQKVDENSLFAIASNTKAFIAASLAILVDEGKINWSDKVRDYLPYFAMYDSYVSENATIADILSHRIGLGTFSGDVIWYKSNYTPEEVIKHIRYIPQAFDFRDGYGYSNLMFITAGEVIKAVSGQPWDEFVKEHFFKQLGMNRTQTSVIPLAQMKDVATPHALVDNVNTPIPYAPWEDSGAAGGIISSVHDLSLWMMLQLNHGILGSDTLFSPERQIDMWTPHNSFRVSSGSKKNLPSRHFSGYGFGWGLSDYKGNMVVSHSGGYDGMYSRLTLVPDQNLGIVILTNAMRGVSYPVTMRLIDAYVGGEQKDWSADYLPGAQRGIEWKKERIQKRIDARVMNTKPTVDEDTFVGNYFDPMYGEVDIKKDAQGLLMEFKSAPALNARLSHWHYNTYKIEWNELHAWFSFGTIQFTLDNNQNVTGIEFDVPNDDIFFDEIHLKRE